MLLTVQQELKSLEHCQSTFVSIFSAKREQEGIVKITRVHQHHHVRHISVLHPPLINHHHQDQYHKLIFLDKSL